MQAMQQLVRMPEIASVMQSLSKEMMRAGIIEEMLEDTMEVLEPEGIEEEAEEEVDKVRLWGCLLYLALNLSLLKSVNGRYRT